LAVEEEVPPGTVVGVVSCKDGDAGANADVAYAIVDGNEGGVFDVILDDQDGPPPHAGLLVVAGRWVECDLCSDSLLNMVKRELQDVI